MCSDDEDCIGDDGEGSGMLPGRAEVRAWRPPKLLVGNIWLNLIEGESPLRGWLSTVLDGWSLIRHFSTSSLSDRDSHQYVFLHTHLELEDSLIGTGTRTRRRMKLLKITTGLANTQSTEYSPATFPTNSNYSHPFNLAHEMRAS